MDKDNFAKRLQDGIKAKYGVLISAARIARDLEHASKFQIQVTSEWVFWDTVTGDVQADRILTHPADSILTQDG